MSKPLYILTRSLAILLGILLIIPFTDLLLRMAGMEGGAEFGGDMSSLRSQLEGVQQGQVGIGMGEKVGVATGTLQIGGFAVELGEGDEAIREVLAQTQARFQSLLDSHRGKFLQRYADLFSQPGSAATGNLFDDGDPNEYESPSSPLLFPSPSARGRTGVVGSGRTRTRRGGR